MTFKAQPIYEGGAVAKSMAALCRQFKIDSDNVKLEVSFSEGRSLYHLYGRASALFSFDEKAPTYEEAETKVARALEQWRTYGVDGGDAEPQPLKPAASQEPATDEQKKELILLVNHPLITRQEKTNAFLNINKMTGEWAAQKIQKVRQAIEARENIQQAA
jgi:hypothetical protein